MLVFLKIDKHWPGQKWHRMVGHVVIAIHLRSAAFSSALNTLLTECLVVWCKWIMYWEVHPTHTNCCIVFHYSWGWFRNKANILYFTGIIESLFLVISTRPYNFKCNKDWSLSNEWTIIIEYQSAKNRSKRIWVDNTLDHYVPPELLSSITGQANSRKDSLRYKRTLVRS